MLKRSVVSSVVSSIAVVTAALTLAACGGGSGETPVTSLAEFVPGDAAVYIQGEIKPDEEVQAKADAISEKLAGSSLGELLKGAVSSSDRNFDFETDVKPWLGDSAAMYVSGDVFGSASIGSPALAGAGDTGYGAVVQTSDPEAAKAFIDDQAKSGQTGEYEGYSYSALAGDTSVAGMVDDNFLAATDVAGFKAMVDAKNGDSLKDDEGFGEVSDKVSDGSLLNVYVAPPEQAQGVDYSNVYRAFGVDPAKAGGMFSLVPEDSEISIRGYTADPPDLAAGDASDLIASFPANTVFAVGTGDLGKNATKVIESLDKEGIPGAMKPGQLGKALDQISKQGIDVRSLVENLQELGLFVQGNAPARLGGALVLTSSDLDSVRSSFKAITGLIRLAGDNSVQPLGGGLTGLSVRTPDLPGRPVVFAIGKDRVVIAIGMPAAMQALKGTGPDLGSDADFKAARESLGGPLAMYAKPEAIARLMAMSPGMDAQAAQLTDILGKFSYMAAGQGEEDGSGELNLGLK